MEAKLLEEGDTFKKDDQKKVIKYPAVWLSRRKVEELRRLYQISPEDAIREEG